MKDEILIQRRHRYWYDRCLELAGAKLVDFGSDEAATREDLEQAIGENTAAVHYVAMEQAPDPHELSLEDTIEVANEHGLPVLVDAAGQIYPLENFREVREDGRFLPVHRGQVPGRFAVGRAGAGQRGLYAKAVFAVVRGL